MPSQMVRIYLNAWKHITGQSRPTKFTDEILYPEHAEKILDTLHFCFRGEVGRGAAPCHGMRKGRGIGTGHSPCENRYRVLPCDEDRQQLPARAFPTGEKNRIVGTLRTKIGYTKEEDGRIVFLPDKPSYKSVFLQLWRMMKSAGRIIFLFPLFRLL